MEVIAGGDTIEIGEIEADGIGRFGRWFVTNEMSVSGVDAFICDTEM